MHRIRWALAISLVLHATIIASRWGPKTAAHLPKKPKAINVVVVDAQKSAQSPSATQISHAGNHGKKAPSRLGPQNANPPTTYKDLLPAAKDIVVVESGPTPSIDCTPHCDHIPNNRLADPMDLLSFQEQVQETTSIVRIAEDLRSRLALPSNLKRIASSGYARAVLRRDRQTKLYELYLVDGDPYFRAYLYDLMSNLDLRMLLNSVEDRLLFPTIDIKIHYTQQRNLNNAPETIVAANKIMFMLYRFPKNDEVGEVKGGLASAGASKEDRQIERHDEWELRRLKQSQAFAQAYRKK